MTSVIFVKFKQAKNFLRVWYGSLIKALLDSSRAAKFTHVFSSDDLADPSESNAHSISLFFLSIIAKIFSIFSSFLYFECPSYIPDVAFSSQERHSDSILNSLSESITLVCRQRNHHIELKPSHGMVV